MALELAQYLVVVYAVVVNVILLGHPVVHPRREQNAVSVVRRPDGLYPLLLHLEHVWTVRGLPAVEAVDDAQHGVLENIL